MCHVPLALTAYPQPAPTSLCSDCAPPEWLHPCGAGIQTPGVLAPSLENGASSAVYSLSCLYRASISAWYFFCSCGRLSLKVGVSSSLSTVNSSGCRWMADTCSKPRSCATRASSCMDLTTASRTCGDAHSVARSPPSPRSLAQGMSTSASGTTTATRCARSESPYTNTCATSGLRWYTFSIFSGAMYSPCASLKMFFLRSMILSAPLAVMAPMSPVWNQPSRSSTSSVLSCAL
mmetsp:Transcript_14212/g.35080  ORF Transcript_14212/g.35080 Transcript_14212/m.35080 type:complete len:234 (-) Transcript_14212:1491-2192(-)